jgi:Bacteriophage lambda head decoration protein D
MPATAQNVYGNQGVVPIYDRGLKAQQHRVKLGVSLTLVKGTLLGQITATGLWRAYASGNADGSQNPKAVLSYDTTTDAAGLHTIGGGQQGETYLDCPAFFSGEFYAGDLTGLDSTAVTNGKFMQLWGDLTTGVIRIPT